MQNQEIQNREMQNQTKTRNHSTRMEERWKDKTCGTWGKNPGENSPGRNGEIFRQEKERVSCLC